MAKFLAGLLVGLLMAYGYVLWGPSTLSFLELPALLKGNLVSSATETVLYDLDQPIEKRRRALEVLFKNRARFAAQVDREFGDAFLENLYRRRVIRAARKLRLAWSAFDEALAKPALRASLEKKHGTTDTTALKQAMLMAAYEREAFLAQWVARNEGPVRPETLLGLLTRLSGARGPAQPK